MTVKQLIEFLQQLPKEGPVAYPTEDGYQIASRVGLVQVAGSTAVALDFNPADLAPEGVFTLN